MKLRPYQFQLVDKARESLVRGSKSPLVVSSTGSGKTITCATIIKSALEKGKRVLFVAPRRRLVFQTAKVFNLMGIDTGVIMSGVQGSNHKQAQVASMDTLVARHIRKEYPIMKFDLVILDEAHLSVSSERIKLLELFRSLGSVVMGLTATPCRGNGSGLPFYDEIVEAWTMRQMIESGYLSPLRYFAPTKPDLERVKLQAGEYNQKQLGEVMNKADLIGDIVDHWKRLGNNKPTIVSCVNRKHSMAVRDEFLSHGITAEHIDCDTPDDEEEAVIARIESGETKILCNVFKAAYGVDIPCLEVCVIARPTKSVVLYMQVVGRVLRTAEGKDYATVIDHSGVVEEHGFAEDIIDWSLGEGTVQERKEKRKTEAKEPKEIECTQCHTIFTSSRSCPNCGHELISKGEPIPCHEAQLVEATIGSSEGKKWNSKASRAEKEQFMGELLGYAELMGYQKGWALHQYRERSDVWPNHYKHVKAIPPTELVKNWVKHQAIKRSRGYAS